MLDSNWLSLLAIPLGYLLGSIPVTMIAGKLLNNIDMRKEGDGHISATAVYRNFGLTPFIIVVILDVAKGSAAIILGGLITQMQWIILAAGFAAMVGHCWSVFMQFRGGFGATVLYGVLAALAFWQLLMSLIVMAILFLAIRRSTLCTIIAVCLVASAIYITTGDVYLTLYPFTLLMVQLIKWFSVRNNSGRGGYQNNLFKDLKRIN
jgi:glycerol-3-phosphate acyltransferase PlsY